MRKAIALLSAAVLAAPTLNAQENEGVRFGIKLAPNMAWLRSDTKNIDGDGSLLGYSFGLLTEFPIGQTGNYRFATGVFLNNIGGKLATKYSYTEVVAGQDVAVNVTSSSTTNLRFVEVPLTIKMMTNEIGLIRYYGQLGVSTAFNIRAKQDFEATTTVGTGAPVTVSDEKVDVQDQSNLFKAGLVVGAGLEYNIAGNTSLLAGITYNNAFTTSNQKDGVSGFDNAKIYADYLELTLGVFF
jgi:hypothetical protein